MTIDHKEKLLPNKYHWVFERLITTTQFPNELSIFFSLKTKQSTNFVLAHIGSLFFVYVTCAGDGINWCYCAAIYNSRNDDKNKWYNQEKVFFFSLFSLSFSLSVLPKLGCEWESKDNETGGYAIARCVKGHTLSECFFKQQ